MEIVDKNLTFERTSGTEVLSSFYCGVRELDRLIHARENGLLSFVSDPDIEMFIVWNNHEPVAVFVQHTTIADTDIGKVPAKELDFIAVRKDKRRMGIGKHILTYIELFAKLNNHMFLLVGAFFNKRYSAVGFYEKCGFVANGERQGNILPMIKDLQD